MSEANYLLNYLIKNISFIKKPSCSSSYGTGYGTDLSLFEYKDLITTAGYKMDHDRGEK